MPRARTTRSRSRSRFTDRVYVRPWNGYVDQKNHAAGLAMHDWIFSLDADERVTEELAAEIRALLAAEPDMRGYRMPRVSFYLGRWMRTTDMYPDYQLRLYDRRHARWDGVHVHESVKVDGAGRISEARAPSLSLPRSVRASHTDGSLHHARGAADVREGPARNAARAAVPPAHRVRAQLPSERGLPRRKSGADHLARELVLRHAEVREALGASRD